MRPIAQYALYLVAGFLQLWLLLLYWGVSAGPANVLPYVFLLAFIELGLIASSLSLFLEKPGAVAAALGGAVGLGWAILGLLSMSPPPFVEAAIVGLLPVIVTVDGFWRLLARRHTSWIEVAKGPNLALRTVLAVVPFAIIGYLALPIITAVEERVVIPDGYMGKVAIAFHSTYQGRGEDRPDTSTTYEIPESGLLLARGGPIRGCRSTKYFYRPRSGPLRPIVTAWSSTIHDTPENRADPTVGIYLRSVGVTTTGACRFEHETFLVGTKAFILSRSSGHTDYELSERMRDLACGPLQPPNNRLERSGAAPAAQPERWAARATGST
jgi:hypothetical protein